MKTSKTKLVIASSLPSAVVVDDPLRGAPAFYNSRATNPDTDFQRATSGILFSKYLPAGIVVTELMEVAHFRGHIDIYLEHLNSKPYTNLLTIVKKELVAELRDILYKVKERNASVTIENISLSINGSIRNISIEAIPLPDITTPHYLILFHENRPIGKLTVGDGKKNTAKTKNEPGHLRIQQLELQLMQTRSDMRSITETQETTNEELRKANEELLSSSEELQSLNDELETNKEDLETTNETLTFLNQELNSLNDQVTAGRNYTDSIIATMMEPLLVLNKNFFIKSANRAFYKTFGVNEMQTVGVLIYELGNKQWDIPKLHKLLEELLPQKRKFTDYKIRRNFPGIGERIMQLNASEIIRDKKEEKLILLSIQDITEKAQLHIQEQEFQRQLEEKVRQRTQELRDANEELQQKNQEIALSKYNKRFITEFSEKYSSNKHDNEFFNSLVQFIADTTRLDYVFVGKLSQNINDESIIETISFTAFGKLAKNISYPLHGSPCEQVIHGKLYSFTEKCGQLFLNSKMPGQSKIEAYLGHSLNDTYGNPVGLITVMHEKSIHDVESIFPVLKIVARRAEIELERIKYGEELVIRNKEKEKQAAELIIANKALAFQIEEKEKRAGELMKANKELESFAYISSHDLQEPLRKIQTFANRIIEKESGGLSDNGKDYLNRMNNAAKRMRALIEDLLAYSKTNSTETEFEKANLAVIITEVKNEFAEIILEKNAVIEVGHLGEVWINISQFRQLLNNLFTNALKFCNTSVAPRIKVSGKIAKAVQFQIDNPNLPDGRLSLQKNYYQLSISDNGIGFDARYKDKIFEVFQRLHSKEEYEGTGIGLAIVKKIAENHNGTITARSEPGKGATFDIYIPAL